MFYIKQGDTSPALRTTLRDAAGALVPLGGATVMFHMAPADGGAVTVDAAAVVIDAANGVVAYEWADGDTDTAGVFKAEFEVTYADATVETFPNDGYMRVKVTPQLA